MGARRAARASSSSRSGTVEINNDIVELEEREREEIRRILLELTDAFRARPADLRASLDVAVDLDVLQAKARFGSIVNGVAPEIAIDGRLELREARHPLLIGASRRRLEGRRRRRPTSSPSTSSSIRRRASS